MLAHIVRYKKNNYSKFKLKIQVSDDRTGKSYAGLRCNITTYISCIKFHLELIKELQVQCVVFFIILGGTLLGIQAKGMNLCGILLSNTKTSRSFVVCTATFSLPVFIGLKGENINSELQFYTQILHFRQYSSM